MGKDRPGHFLIFIIFWTTFVYDPIARWSWNLDGWLNKKGSLDFAGGTCVHICAGASVLAHSLFHRHLHKFESSLNNSWIFRDPKRMSEPDTATPPLDPGSTGPIRPNMLYDNEPDESPHSMEYVILGTTLLWAGWFGFNGGSALGANVRAVSACVSTHLAACSGGVTLCVLRTVSEYMWPSRAPGRVASRSSQHDDTFVFSIIEFCNGAIIGLVCITPAAGYVPHYVAPVFGFVGALWCSWFTPLGVKIGDTHGIVVVHAFAGFMGMFLTGIFASKKVAHLDGFTVISGGAWDGNRIQIG
jgi:ammonium transporter, Amt family